MLEHLHLGQMKGTIYEPLYKLNTKPLDWELELINSKPIRRLKHLYHFGGAALLSSVTHSRYEHTLGVWSLVAYYFPQDFKLRAAALLHDTGHYPFSHALERALDLNHHLQTIEIIQSAEISDVLSRAELDQQEIINILNRDTPLTNKSGFIGLDHLDSFFRDTQAAGLATRHPTEVNKELSICGNYLNTNNLDIAQYITQLVLLDHQLFLKPTFLAADKLLTQAVQLHYQGKEIARELGSLTDFDLLAILQASDQLEVRRLVHLILYEPFRLKEIEGECTQEKMEGLQSILTVQVKKVYQESLLYQGKPLIQQCKVSKEAYESLKHLVKTYYVSY